MRNLILFLCTLPVFCAAQTGYINTIAGNGTSGCSGDGGPATAARIGQALGNIVVDGSGNIYFHDDDNHRIRKVNTAGNISTIAGGGSSTADGIPAISATLNFYGNGVMAMDATGNIYVIDDHRLRKIAIATGIITTVAGTMTAGYSGDGGPATSAKLNSPVGLCFDASGNIYIGDEDNYRIRKVNTAGIISTYAGTGSSGFSGDGGPATAAQMQSPDGLCFDALGNLYVADRYNYRIRRITPAGIISTYAGAGSSGFSGDGGSAIAAGFSEPSQLCMDNFGNLYIADFHNSRVRKIDPFGIISTFAGGGSSMSSGIPATSASLTDVWAIGIDGSNNIYVADRNNYRILKVNGTGTATAVADSFSVYANQSCAGPEFSIIPVNYSTSLNIKTWFGDGTNQTNTFSAVSGYCMFNHVYNTSGTYTVKHVLYSGTTARDSVSHSYTYQFCRTLPVRLYYDANANCAYDTNSESFTNHPTTAEVDSNGIAIDTMIFMSGIDYNAYGSPGTVYKFKVLNTAPGLTATCPSTGIISDTIVVSNNPIKYVGFQCSGTPGFDLKEHVFIQSGKHMQSGHLVVNNTYCTPQSAVLTVNFSPKYEYQSANPTPISVSGTTITWNLGTLSSIDNAPKNIHYTLNRPGPDLLPGDTVNSSVNATPVTGDMIPGNNTCVEIDTVKSSYDPNEMDVSPAGCIAAGTTLTYSTQFENTGNDTAQNIYILDTLPNTLDIHSLAMVASSHSVILSKTFNGNNWVLKFDFPNIKLLDSTHHNQCTGLFVFTIRAFSTIVPGAVIPNRAGIYFDDNPVVMTNTATDIICYPAMVNIVATKKEITLYPNPLTNMLHIDNVASATTYKLINIVGRTIQQGELHEGENALSLPPLMQGLYIVELADAQGNRIVRKMVKE